jgi:transcriptional regulator with XRE-family HTH domain
MPRRTGTTGHGAIAEEIDLRRELIALRRLRRVSRAELARRLGVNELLIARLEKKKTTRVMVSTLVRVAAALDGRVRVTIEPLGEPGRTRRTRKPGAA